MVLSRGAKSAAKKAKLQKLRENRAGAGGLDSAGGSGVLGGLFKTQLETQNSRAEQMVRQRVF